MKKIATLALLGLLLYSVPNSYAAKTTSTPSKPNQVIVDPKEGTEADRIEDKKAAEKAEHKKGHHHLHHEKKTSK